MIEIKTKLRRGGNSLGIVVPLNKIEKADLEEGKEVKVFIVEENKVNLKKLFGAHKFKKSIEQLMRETDKELYNE